MTIEAPTRAYRAAEIIDLPSDRAEGAPAEVTVSFSSEAPYMRARFNAETGEVERFLEVLGHRDGEADLSILNSGAAPVLKDHDNRIDSQVGTVVRAWVEGGKGMARLRFSRDATGEALAARVLSGDVTNISVGYDREGMREDGESDGVPVVRVDPWVPREISWVAVPADPTVGHGRADGTVATTPINQPHKRKVDTMSNETDAPQGADQTTRAADSPAQAPAARPVDHAAIMREERARVADIETAADQAARAGSPMDRQAVREAIRNGESAADFGARVLEHLSSAEATQARATRADIGMTEKEVQTFSLARLLRAIAPTATADDINAAGFEIEATTTAARKKRSQHSDYTIPTDVLATWGQRDASAAAMETTTAAAGGNMVPVEHRGGDFIEGLVNRMSIMRAGATMLTGLSGDVDIPKETQGATAYWVPQTGAGSGVNESTPQVGTLNLTPHTIAAAVPYTRKMRLQADPSVEGFVRRVIQRDLALLMDQTALVGSADADAPAGLLDLIPGAHKANWDNASTYTWSEVVDMQSLIEDANADLDEMTFICRGSTYHAMRQVPLEAGASAFLAAAGEIDGVPALRTSQAAAAQVFLGAFPQFVVAMWSGLDLRFDPYTYAASDGHVVRVFQDVDFDVRHGEAFALTENA